MGRVRENIEINGRQCWTLFDTGARNTYVVPEVASLDGSIDSIIQLMDRKYRDKGVRSSRQTDSLWGHCLPRSGGATGRHPA